MKINIYLILSFWLLNLGSGNFSGIPESGTSHFVDDIDFTVAQVVNVTTSSTNGAYSAGALIEISVNFDLAVNVTGAPILLLNTGDEALFVSGSGTENLLFEYVVQTANGVDLVDVNDLNYSSTSALELNGGTIVNDADNANLVLPGLGSPNALSGSSNIGVDTTSPDLTGSPFSPENSSINAASNSVLSISFNENVSGAGTANIQIVDATTMLSTTLDGASAFSNSNSTQLNFDLSLYTLDPSSRYYVTIAAGAIRDQAGNDFEGFSGTGVWTFSTFGPPIIDTYPAAACVGEVISIEGDYFSGLTSIIIKEGVDEVIIPSTAFNALSNTEVIFEIPTDALTGVFTLVKDNGSTVSTDTDEAIKIGPSAAEIDITGDQFLCFDSEEGTNPTSEIGVEITGASGTYTLVYSQNGSNITVNNYTSGAPIVVTPPLNGSNEYELISVVSNDPDFSSCSPDLGSSETITRFRRSVVDAGGTFDSGLGYGVVELCVTENNSIDLGSAAEMNGNFPSIDGSVSTGQWSIFNGPANGGGFSQNFSQKTSNTIGATYYPNIADGFAGEVILRLTSSTPSNPNNTCSVSEDFIMLRFITSNTANPGQAPNICKDANNEQTDLVRLNGSSEGGIVWSLDDNYYDVGDYDNSWGFADTPNANSFTATSNNKNAYYRAKEEQLIAEDVIVNITPISAGGACSGSPAPIELTIPVNDVPVPTNLNGPSIICSGANTIRFSIDRDPNFSNNTFEWTITNPGSNVFDGGTNGSSVFINFREVSTATLETISVREINNVTGCVSEPISMNVTVQPLPQLTVSFTGGRAFSQSSGLLALQEGDSPIITTTPAIGGTFSGPGVVLSSDSLYYLNPASLSETNLGTMADDHIITFTYEDEFGCANSVNFGIDIFNANDIFPQLSDFYCETDDAVNISVNNAILESNQSVISITGPGVTYIGGNSATFNPEIARNEINENNSEVRITFSVYNGDTDSNIENVATQSIQVIQNPNPVFFPINDFYCSDESDIRILRNTDLNPNGKFNFALVDQSLPTNLITGDSTIGYSFNPNQLNSSQLENDSIEIEIRYTYFNNQDCQNDSVFSTVIYRKPSAPILEQTELCIINGVIETAIIDNVGEFNSEVYEWYSNSQLAGEALARGQSFTPQPQQVTQNSTVFYVVRRNNQNQNSSQCLSPVSSVTFKRINNPDFDWNQSSYKPGESITFSSTTNSVDLESHTWILEKEESGIFIEKEQVILDATISSTTFNFNVLGAGLYKMTLLIENDFGCTASVSKEMVFVEELPTGNNYRFNFDSDPQGWVATGNNSSWEWAIPQTHLNSSIENQNPLWITGADTTFKKSERSYMYSPVFNLSQIEKPSVSFDLWFDLTPGTDGLILEYSTDEKLIEDPSKNWERLGDFSNNVSSGINWYNRSGIRSAPATSNNNLLLSGWTSVIDSVSTRIPAKHILDGISNKEKVLFRFHFATTESSDLLDGVAFDNFIIESRNRTVLVEYFGNEAFNGDALEMDFLNDRSVNTNDFAWINYRVNESDPYFKENSSATLSRMFFYNAYSSESTFSLDGNYVENGIFSSSPQNQNTLNQRALIPSPMELDFDIAKISNEELEIKVDLTSNTTLDDLKKLHVIVVNDSLKNDEKVYYHVLRQFLTPLTGFIPGDQSSFTYNFRVKSPLDTMALSLVAFIQDDSTSNILQAATKQLPRLSTNLVLSNNPIEMDGLLVYPNPAHNSIKFYHNSSLKTDYKGRIVNLTGKTVREFELRTFSKGTELDTSDLMDGLYTIQFWNEAGNNKTLKLVIKH